MLHGIKNYLDITWQDTELDKKLQGMIDRGIAYINSRGGKTFDYELEGIPRMLLFNYVMYENSGMLSEFFINYMSELVALRLESRVEYAEYQK